MRIAATLLASLSLLVPSPPVAMPSQPFPHTRSWLSPYAASANATFELEPHPRVPPTDPQTKLSISDLYKHSFEVDMPYDQKIHLELRSGSFRVAGSSNQKISVHVSGKNAENARDFTLDFKRFGNRADVSILGGSTNLSDIEITIEVPKAADLYIRMPFGELSVEGVSGDKDVELHAGDLNIEVGNAADYAHVDASVGAGDLSAGPFGETHDGLFRSFEKAGSGRYKLHAHLGAGDLTLR